MLPQFQEPKENDLIYLIRTNQGDIEVKLFPEFAPKTVENFTTHADNGYYDNGIFHRVIRDFMIQGGDPTGTGRGGESIFGETFEDEFDPKLRNFRGALSMANRGPGTNGSQFFLVTVPQVPAEVIGQMKEIGVAEGFSDEVIEAYEQHGGAYWLDGKHTVFGQIVGGMDVVDAISNLDTDAADRPKDEVTITGVTKKQNASV